MKLFIKDNKGYIIIYFISVLLTIIYLSLLGVMKFSEGIYILLFNTFILACFLSYRYYKNKEVYGLLEKGLNSLDESFKELGNSLLAENLSKVLKEEHNFYEAEILKSNGAYNEHITFISQWVHPFLIL